MFSQTSLFSLRYPRYNTNELKFLFAPQKLLMKTYIATGILSLIFACSAVLPASGQSVAILGGYTQPNSPDLLSDVYTGNVEIKVRGTYDIDTTPLHLLAQANYSRSGLDSDNIDGGAINRAGGMIGFGAHIDIESFRVYTHLASGMQATRTENFSVLGITTDGADWSESIGVEGAAGVRWDVSSRIALQAETSYAQLSSGENPSWISFLGGIAIRFN
jgi:hypothetical protein